MRFLHFLIVLTLGSLFCSALAALSVLHAAMSQSGFGTEALVAPVDGDAVLDFLAQVPLKKLAFIFLTQAQSHILVLLMVSLNALLVVGWLVQGLLFAWSVSGSELKAAREHTLNFIVFRLIFLGSMLETMSGPSNHTNPAVTGTLPAAPGAGPLRELACWLMWFGFIGFLRWFLVLLRERFQSAQASPYATVDTFRKYLAVTLVFTALNVLVAFVVVVLAASHTTWTVLSLLLFENIVLLFSCCKIAFRYVLYIQTLRKEQPWEERGPALYYSDMACEVSVQVVTLVHLLHIWWHYGMSLSLLDLFLFLHVRQLFVGVWRNLQALRTYRRSVFELNARFPDASPAELERLNDDVCSICRDAMEQAKKLPCGHLFHRTCLIQWVEHASFCPTCRAPLLPRRGSAAQPAAGAAQQQQQQQHLRPAAAPVGGGYPGQVANARALALAQPHGVIHQHALQHGEHQQHQQAAAAGGGSGLAPEHVQAAQAGWMNPSAMGLRHRSNAAAAAASHAASTGATGSDAASPSSILGLSPSASASQARPSAGQALFRPSSPSGAGSSGSTSAAVPQGVVGSDDTEASYRAALAEAAHLTAASSPGASDSHSSSSTPTALSMRERIAEATQRRLRQAGEAKATAANEATQGQTDSLGEAGASQAPSYAAVAAASASAAAAAAAAAEAPSVADAAGSPSNSSSSGPAHFALPPVTSSPALLSQADADLALARELQREEELLHAQEMERRRNGGAIARFFSGAL